VALRAGFARPELVVDIKGIPGIDEISWSPSGDLVLGAAVPVRRIAADPRIRQLFPALAEGTLAIGSPQIRCRATVGGNLANASPCMDTAPPLLLLGARLRIAGPHGAREIPLEGFFAGVKKTVLAEGEIVTAIVVPAPSPDSSNAFDKIKRVFGHDLALVNAAALFDRRTRRLRGAIGSCGTTPVLLPEIEIPGSAGAREAGELLAARALGTICPIDDVRASAEYRRDMAALLCRRLAGRLVGEAAGGAR
jgi:carbon-monoxide dehydrogenase medium subunit